MPTPVGNPKQIDPASIPPAVRRAAERADKAMKEQAAAREQQQQQQPDNMLSFQELPQPEPDRPQDAAPPVEPPAAPEPHQPEPHQPEPQRAAEPSAEPSAAPPAGDEAWEERYKRQLGHTRRLQQDLQVMATRMDEMQRLLSTVQSAPPPAAAAPPTVEQLLTPEEKEEWKEVLPVMEKRFREMYAPIQHELQTEINELKQQVGHEHKTTAARMREQLYHTLNTHPVFGLQSEYSWHDLNKDDGFVGWLQYLDPMSGLKRHSMLKEAYDLNDAGRMVAIFGAYLREAGLTPATPQPNGNGAGSPPPSSNGLERLAAPGPTRSAPASSKSSAGPQYFTNGDVARFFADKTAGRWKGREKEAIAYEAELFKAGDAGRIRPGPPQP